MSAQHKNCSVFGILTIDLDSFSINSIGIHFIITLNYNFISLKENPICVLSMSYYSLQECESVNDICCNYTTCKLYDGKDCSEGVCCTSECQVRQWLQCGIIYVNKRSVLRRQSRDTNRNMKWLVYCQYG